MVLFFTNNGNLFFMQPRPGKGERIFSIIKFRTMNEKKDENDNLLPDNERITRIGKFIRKNSIDELPQLVNVLKGDLSLIGQRPLLVEYLPLYSDFQRRRHEVRPGITGWAQVNGRNAITWEEKFKLDVYYVENISLILDMKIVFKTIYSVLKRSDVYNVEGFTMEMFKGNKQ
jgi:undecaprenyl phosphate N,N'-diacetylbacillosamine 1-phosphate transferase